VSSPAQCQTHSVTQESVAGKSVASGCEGRTALHTSPASHSMQTGVPTSKIAGVPWRQNAIKITSINRLHHHEATAKISPKETALNLSACCTSLTTKKHPVEESTLLRHLTLHLLTRRMWPTFLKSILFTKYHELLSTSHDIIVQRLESA